MENTVEVELNWDFLNEIHTVSSMNSLFISYALLVISALCLMILMVVYVVKLFSVNPYIWQLSNRLFIFFVVTGILCLVIWITSLILHESELRLVVVILCNLVSASVVHFQMSIYKEVGQ